MQTHSLIKVLSRDFCSALNGKSLGSGTILKKRTERTEEPEHGEQGRECCCWACHGHSFHQLIAVVLIHAKSSQPRFWYRWEWVLSRHGDWNDWHLIVTGGVSVILL